MTQKHHPQIAREGWPWLAASAAVVAFAAMFAPALVLPAVALVFVSVLKFRDPEREVPAEPLGVVSPVDGVVESVETVRDPCLDRDSVRIRIKIARFGAYSARAPIEAKIGDLNGHGKDRSATRGMWLHSDEGDDVLLAINTAPAIARPCSMVGYGSRVGQGQRVAWLRLARVAEVHLPVAAKVSVEPGRRVLAGSDLLAVLVHD